MLVGRMLGAPVSRSAHGRRGAGRAWRLQTRRPQASPLFRLVSDHVLRPQPVYDERFASEYGPWRPVVAQVADKFLACGVLEHGFARIQCDDCAHDPRHAVAEHRTRLARASQPESSCQPVGAVERDMSPLD